MLCLGSFLWFRSVFATRTCSRYTQVSEPPILSSSCSRYTQVSEPPILSQQAFTSMAQEPARIFRKTRATQTLSHLHPPRCALFWDADNVGPKTMHNILKSLDKMNMMQFIDIKKAYGDLHNKNKPQWRNIWSEHNFTVVAVTPVTTQKNNADFEMALDVLEVVLTQNICTIIVVSSDVDFCPLAKRVRQHGIKYWGFGHKWTPKKYQDACTHFFVSE